MMTVTGFVLLVVMVGLNAVLAGVFLWGVVGDWARGSTHGRPDAREADPVSHLVTRGWTSPG
jgi:hypothetical protein